MRVTRITERRVRNLGNYETRTIEWEALLDEGEDPRTAARELQHEVEVALGLAEPELPAVGETTDHPAFAVEPEADDDDR